MLDGASRDKLAIDQLTLCSDGDYGSREANFG